MSAKTKAIRFKVPWCGHPKGRINTTLGRGVMQTLVDNNKAEWVAAEPERRRGRPKSESQE